MNLILILIKNYIISSKRDFLPLSFYFFSFPILLYLFLVIPFNSLFQSLITDSSLIFRPTYLYQSFASIMYVSCAFIAFFMPLLHRLKMRGNPENNEYILSIGITDTIRDSSIILWSIICVFIQYIISLTVIISLSKIHITSYELFLFTFLTFIVAIFFSGLGLFISNFIKSRFMVVIISIFFILFLCFGSGTFIPLHFYPESYIQLSNYNIFHFLYNAYIIIFNDIEIPFKIIFLTIFFSFIMLLLQRFYSEKNSGNYIK